MYYNSLVAHSAYAASKSTAKYLAPTGDDSNRGTIDSPWLTLAKAYQNLQPGGIAYCRGGTYANVQLDAYVVTTVGTASQPITVRNYPGETPVFSGGNTTYNSLGFDNGAAYHVIDGLQFTNFLVNGAAIIYWGQTGAIVHDCLVRRCKFTARSGQTSNEHNLYISQNSKSIVVGGAPGMGNIIIGVALQGAGVEMYHAPTADNSSTISYNVFDSTQQGVEIANPNIYGTQILHNTFVNCYNKVKASYHNTLLVRDNAGDAQQNGDLMDNDAPSRAFTTQDHNAWTGGASPDWPGMGVSTISAGPNYLLTAGPGIGGASDGTNCGWAGQNFNA